MDDSVIGPDGPGGKTATWLGGRWCTHPWTHRITENRVTRLAHYLGMRGDRALNQGDLARAEAWYNTAQKLKPDYAPTLYSLGRLAKRRGNLDEAARLFRDVVANSGSLDYRTAAMVDLAEVQYAPGDRERAMDTARRAIAFQAMGSNNEWTRWHQARAYNALGCDATDRGDLDEAVRCFTEAVRLAPDCTAWLVWLAATHSKRGEPARAIECLRKAIDLEPEDAELHGRLGYLYAHNQNMPGAVGEYMRAVELEQDNAHARHGLGCALNKLNYHQEAERQLREAMRLAPDDPLAQSNLGIVLNALYGHRRAARWLRSVIRAHPDYALAHLQLARVLWGRGRPRDVRAAFRRAIALDDGTVGADARKELADFDGFYTRQSD